MVYFILQIILFIVFIILGHCVWIYFKDTFTIKKTKDLNTTIEKYKLLIESNISNNNINHSPLALEEESDEIKTVLEDDLNQFLNAQLQY